MNTGEIAARNWQIARLFRAAGKNDRVEIFEQADGIEIDPDIDAVVEIHALRLHLHDAAVDHVFFHLEVGNAVAQQTAGFGILLVRHALHGRRARAAARRQARQDPSRRWRFFCPCVTSAGSGLTQPFAKARSTIAHSMVLIVTGLIVDIQRAGGLARRWANTAGEFRKIVRRMKISGSLLPIGVVDEVVPIRDLIVDRATVVAIRNAAIHAARRLILGRFLGKRDHELLVMTDPVGRRRIAPVAPVDFEESRYLAHIAPNPLGHDCFQRDRANLSPGLYSPVCRRMASKSPVLLLTLLHGHVPADRAANPSWAGGADALRPSFGRRETGRSPLGDQLLDRAAIFDRHHLTELGLVFIPLFENEMRPRRARIPRMIAK